MGIVIDIHDSNETKFQRFKRKSKENFDKVKTWCADHPQEALGAITVFVTGAAGVSKTIGKQVALHKEKHLKDDYIYDRSLGRYVELRKKLNQKDLVEISRRKREGERLTDILLDMRLVR